MVILGLTGSIGMGKSTTAAMFRDLGVPVHDSDATVHRLYSGAAAPLIEAAFPGVVEAGNVNRALLGQRVLGNAEAMQCLEAIVHPLVRDEEQAFLKTAAASRAPVAVVDIPLLFETKGENRVDVIAVVTASPEIQRQRVLARPGMTEERFGQILARQMPDAEKRRRAHFVVDTGQGLDHARRQVRDILRALAGMTGAIGNT
jgi:dephospho-CoA kinase